jgi:outer membrane protein TolC
VEPRLTFADKEIPDSSELFQEALRVNPAILALQNEVEAARNKVLAERARYRPTLSAEIEVGEYHRPLNSRNDFGASLMLRVPIYEGNETKAEIANATAMLANRTAQLKKAEQNLLKTIASLVKELEILNTRRNTATQRLSYRDLDLEHKRALYEMEVQTTLSDAQARITEAQWLAKKVEYDTALVWAQLNMLMGKPLIPQQEVTSP